MRLRRLIITLAATTLIASATAEGDATEPIPFSVLTNATLSCSVKAPSLIVGCYLERPVAVLGGLELAVGVDAQAALRGGDSHLAPYGIAAYYAPTWSAWLEVMLPDLGIPVIGAPDWLRFGFSYRF